MRCRQRTRAPGASAAARVDDLSPAQGFMSPETIRSTLRQIIQCPGFPVPDKSAAASQAGIIGADRREGYIIAAGVHVDGMQPSIAVRIGRELGLGERGSI